MAYAEKRGKLWRARWRGPDGTLESKPGFQRRTEAEKYGRDQEAAIRAGTYVDPRAGQISLTDWVNDWYPSLDLEPTTLSNYRYAVEVHILPVFGNRPLASLTAEEIATWQKNIARSGYSRRTASDARSTLTTILADAIPRYIQANPAARRRGKGRKGLRRIERAEKAEKAWATPLQALLIAERCAALSGHDTDFVMIVTLAYTGIRWSELIGLGPSFVHNDRLSIDWKLYELGRFYRGRPKDGSVRAVDLPPFLAGLVGRHLDVHPDRRCTCRATEAPWCPGDDYVFLGPGAGHFRRGVYGQRFLRPAADGCYPRRTGRDARPPMPVLADVSCVWPGRPVRPWPAATPGEPFAPPTGRGVHRLVGDDGKGSCGTCDRTMQLRLDGTVISHKANGQRCDGSGEQPGGDVPLASWLPVLPGMTAHGLRHGHQTWLEHAGIPYVLISDRMGHEVSGMRGVYSHVSAAMRTELTAYLEQVWEDSVAKRARLAPRSPVSVLDNVLRARHD